MPLPGLPFSDHELYSILNTGVLPFWVLLAVAPRWKNTPRTILGVVCFYSAVYVALLVPILLKSDASLDFSSLTAVVRLFSKESNVLLGWIHYLAFDLWTGWWITKDALQRGFPRPLVIPILFFTLMFGPTGLLLYIVARSLRESRSLGGIKFD